MRFAKSRVRDKAFRNMIEGRAPISRQHQERHIAIMRALKKSSASASSSSAVSPPNESETQEGRGAK